MKHDTCTRLDDVLAVFLDGEPATCDRLGEEPLGEHLQECPVCLDALERSRRLDATLATHADVSVEDELAERLLRRAMPQEPLPDSRRSRRRLVATIGVLVLVPTLLTLGFLWGRTFGADRAAGPHDQQGNRAPRVARGPSPGVTPKADARALPEMIPLPDRDGPRTRSARRPGRSMSPAELLENDSLGPAVVPLVVLFRSAGIATTPAELAFQTRVVAAQRLLRSASPRDTTHLCNFLAHHEHEALLQAIFVHVRNDTTFLAKLNRRVSQQDADAMRVAARLGSPTCDHRLLQLARRKPALAERMAVALASVRMRANRIRLLCELWLISRNCPTQHPNEDKLQRWFGTLPDTATAALIRQTRGSHNRERRRLCLLALATTRDPAAAGFLLEQVEGASQEEALVAGHALTRLRGDAVATAIERALRGSRRSYVLRAALAGRKTPTIRHYIAGLDLTVAEHRFLLAGDYSLPQFSIAAQLLRSRKPRHF